MTRQEEIMAMPDGQEKANAIQEFGIEQVGALDDWMTDARWEITFEAKHAYSCALAIVCSTLPSHEAVLFAIQLGIKCGIESTMIPSVKD